MTTHKEALEAAMKAFALIAHGLTPDAYDADRIAADEYPKGRAAVAKSVEAMNAAITAYLSAMAGESGDVVERLTTRRSSLHGDWIAVMAEAAAALSAANVEIARLTRERDEWREKWVTADEGEKVNSEFLAHSDARAEAAEAKVAEAVAAEREECAKRCDELATTGHRMWAAAAVRDSWAGSYLAQALAAKSCAVAIRAREKE